jgi:hypothetical protein
MDKVIKEIYQKVPYKFELYSGPYGCGKTTSLINKYKEVRESRVDTSRLKFFVMDSLCEYMNKDTDINSKREITFLPFSSVFSLISIDKSRTNKYFIDNVDIFISSEGIYTFEKVLENTNELYISSLNEKMLNAIIEKKDSNMSIAITEMELSIVKYLKTIPRVKIHEMLMQDNQYLPSDYIKQIKEMYGISETEEL